MTRTAISGKSNLIRLTVTPLKKVPFRLSSSGKSLFVSLSQKTLSQLPSGKSLPVILPQEKIGKNPEGSDTLSIIPQEKTYRQFQAEIPPPMFMTTLFGSEDRVTFIVCLTPDSKMNFELTMYETSFTRISTSGT